MSIMWRYLDKRSATIAAIKDYNNMKFIIRDTGEEIRSVYEGAAGLSSPKLDDMPKAHNPTAGEDRTIKAIEEIDLLRERYRHASTWPGSSQRGTRFRKMTGSCWTPFSAAATSMVPVRLMWLVTGSVSNGRVCTGRRTERWKI